MTARAYRNPTTRLRPEITERNAKSDAALVWEFLNKDEREKEEAFRELVERYQNRLLNFIYRAIGDRAKAEDLVQETFDRVHRHIDRFDNSKKFSTWIYTIASNLAKNELRNRSRCPIVLFGTITASCDDDDWLHELADPHICPDAMYRRRHLRKLIEETVAKLPEHHRQVFILRELEGLSYGEIVEIVGCHLGTVKSRLFRARDAFASLMSSRRRNAV